MADTGTLSFVSQDSGWSVSHGVGSGTMLTDDGNTSMGMLNQTAIVSNASLGGSDIGSGATINGCEVFLTDFGYFASYSASTLEIKLSIDGGSSFSSAKTQALDSAASTLPTTDYTIGSSSDTWGLSWGTGGVDISDLQVSVKATGSGFMLVFGDYIGIKIYYTLAVADSSIPPILNVKSGYINLKSGKLIIK